MNIVIVGAGWYGMYLAKKLSEVGGYNITIIECEQDIFMNNASRYNQCRLHLGFHYPRSHETRTLCKIGFTKFMEEFPQLTYEIPNNWYVISEESILDYHSYNAIFSHEMYDINVCPTTDVLQKIDTNQAIIVKERGINPSVAAEYFRTNLQGKVTFLFNHRVTSISDNWVCGVVEGKNAFSHSFDFCFDCTNFQVLKPSNVAFEQTITMLYRKKRNDVPFGALTVMDGPFFSIFPYDPDNQIYSLTHVKHTVLTDKQLSVDTIRHNMETDVVQYYPSFLDCFEYVSFFMSPKTKPLSKSDSRRLMIEKQGDNNVVAVSCGKITGIFQMFDELFL
jgi:hypothetical protein